MEAELHLVASYIAFAYPEDRVITRVRLGLIEPLIYPDNLTPEDLTQIGSFRRWADAIVIRPRELVLIEGAIRPSLGDISQLEGYKLLIPVTPELADWKTLPIKMELVAAIEDPVVSMLASQRDIRFVKFTTPETEQYLEIIAPRFARAPRAGGLTPTT